MSAGKARPRPQSRARKSRTGLWLGVAGLAAVVLVAAALVHRPAGAAPDPLRPAAASPVAPDGAWTAVDGQTATVASLRGRPALLWFVATWCPSCQAGTQAVAQHIDQLSAAHVQMVELELYRDLGQPGPDIGLFGRTYAGSAFSNPDWAWGTASKALTLTYDGKGYLDIYYLLDAQGRIRYVNGSPAASWPQLWQAIQALGGKTAGS